MANPRIDELRRRLEREPGSRLFAQLAEELRKDGDLTGAIRIARAGLSIHSNYPSARMTLGHALFGTGDLAGARSEFESVLRGAPDNILASRLLGECLEGLGDTGTALLQYRATLRLAPGDRQLEARIRTLEQKLAAGPVRAEAPPLAPAVEATRAATAPALKLPPLPPLPPLRAAPSRPWVAPLPALVPLGESTLPELEANATAALADADIPLPTNPPAVRVPMPPTVAAAPLPVAAPAEVEASPAEVMTSATPEPRRSGSAPASVPPPSEGASAEDFEFDSALDTAPPWGGDSFRAPAASTHTTSLLDDGEPTMPGTPSPFATGLPPLSSWEPPAEMDPPPAPPTTQAFDAVVEHAQPAAQRPLAPPDEPADLWFAETKDDPADTLAGRPAFVMPDAFEPHPAPAEAPPPPPAAAAAAAATPPAREAEAAPAPVPALSSSTLAELYFDQGLHDRAIEVYEELLEREPHNERARARMIEIRSFARLYADRTAASSTSPAAVLEDASHPKAARRAAVLRTISRLEDLLAAVRRR